MPSFGRTAEQIDEFAAAEAERLDKAAGKAKEAADKLASSATEEEAILNTIAKSIDVVEMPESPWPA